MVGEENFAASFALRDLGEEFVSRVASRSFNRHLFLRGQRADIGRTAFEIEIVIRGELLDEFCIGFCRSSSQLVIQMTDDQFFVAKIDKRMQQRDGISPAGDADEVTTR